MTETPAWPTASRSCPLCGQPMGATGCPTHGFPAAPTIAEPPGYPAGPPPAEYPPAEYPPTGYQPTDYPATEYPPLGSPPPYPQLGSPDPLVRSGAGYPPADPTPSGHAGFAPPPRSRRQVGAGQIAVGGVGVLLLAAIVVLAVIANNLNDSLHQLRRDSDHNAQQLKSANDVLGSLEKRTSKLEAKTGSDIDTQGVAQKVLPSVFTVIAGDALGSGFAFGKDGDNVLIITNAHVVADQEKAHKTDVTVAKNNSRATFPGKITRYDPDLDLAVISLKGSYTVLKPSPGSVRPGQAVVAVGAPLGLQGTVTAGVVSQLRDDLPGKPAKVKAMIQHSALITHGNSGGPLVDDEGRVVGVNSSGIENASGLNFAIPVNEICSHNLVNC
ncbi:MAG: S1C family serine protease [Mycobacteriales bacterium]